MTMGECIAQDVITDMPLIEILQLNTIFDLDIVLVCRKVTFLVLFLLKTM